MKNKGYAKCWGANKVHYGRCASGLCGKESVLAHNNMLFSVMVNDLVSTWPKRAKYVDDLTILEIIPRWAPVPRNSPSYLNCIVDDI